MTSVTQDCLQDKDTITLLITDDKVVDYFHKRIKLFETKLLVSNASYQNQPKPELSGRMKKMRQGQSIEVPLALYLKRTFI